MANEINTGDDVSVLAGADLSAKQFYVVKDNGSNACVLSSAATDKHLGILQSKPTSGRVAAIRTGGMSKAVAGGTIATGDALTSDAAGKVIATTTAGNRVVGYARSAGAAGEIVSVLVDRTLY